MDLRDVWITIFFAFFLSTTTSAWTISAARSISDWQKLASLVVLTFDSPGKDATFFEKIQWNTLECAFTEQFTYQQYVSTARKMRGSKYDIILAKDQDRVIGMAEVGVVSRDGDSRRATIGVLCVDPEYRGSGVGKELVKRCERIVADVWKDQHMYAEIESSNQKALVFFESQGYATGQEEVMVTVRRRRQEEQRPHLLLHKALEIKESCDDSNAVLLL